MVIVRLIETGEELDVIGRVGYTRQVGDIGDIGKVNSSYSWTLKFPKTEKNTRILKGLGLIGSASRVPYEKIKVDLIHNGNIITTGASLHIKETNKKEYKGNLKNGVVEFFEAIQNDKLGELDLSDLRHERSFSGITGTWGSDMPYKYLMAGYNGRILPDVSGVSNFDGSGLIPSVNCGWLLDKIFDKYGWEYEGLLRARDTWMTYPTADTESGAWEVLKGDAFDPDYMVAGQNQNIGFNRTAIDSNYVAAGDPFGNVTLIAGGEYRLKIPKVVWHVNRIVEREIGIYINNVEVFSTDLNYIFYIDLPPTQPNDVLAIRIKAQDGDPDITEGDVTYEGELSLVLKNVTQIDFTIPLMDMSVRDFLKEMMMQESSVPVNTDVKNKKISFKNLGARIKAPPETIKLSEYIMKQSESYVYRDYGQNNFFKHKYDEDGDDFNDGNLRIDNRNIKVNNTVYEGKGFSPLENSFTAIFGGGEVELPVLKMFDIEVKEDGNNIEIEYKPLKKRFYFCRTNETPLVDKIYIDNVSYAGEIPIAEPILWSEIVREIYRSCLRLLNDSQLIKARIFLPRWKINQLSFAHTYYVESEMSHFLINKVTYDNDKGSSIELIKVSK